MPEAHGNRDGDGLLANAHAAIMKLLGISAKPPKAAPAPLASSALKFAEDGSFTMTAPIAKVDVDRQMVWGWASVIEENGVPVVDHHGDVIAEQDLSDAVYDFMLNSRSHNEMHAGDPTGAPFESVVFTKQTQQALGIDLKKVGWFVGVKVTDPSTWAKHRDGTLTMFSIEGQAVREEINVGT